MQCKNSGRDFFPHFCTWTFRLSYVEQPSYRVHIQLLCAHCVTILQCILCNCTVTTTTTTTTATVCKKTEYVKDNKCLACPSGSLCNGTQATGKLSTDI